MAKGSDGDEMEDGLRDERKKLERPQTEATFQNLNVKHLDLSCHSTERPPPHHDRPT